MGGIFFFRNEKLSPGSGSWIVDRDQDTVRIFQLFTRTVKVQGRQAGWGVGVLVHPEPKTIYCYNWLC